MKVTYYVEMLSSWCTWVEPTWAQLKQRYAGRAEFEWKIALMKPEDFPVSRAQCDWFYQRSGGTVMHSPFMLNSGWFDPDLKGHYEAPNRVAEAGKDFGFTGDEIRLALNHAMRFDVEPSSFFKDAIIVNDLVIDQPEFVYETRVVSSNIGDLMKNIEAALGPTTEPKDPEAKPRKFIVKHFMLQNAKVTVGVGPAAIPLTLPAVELTNLGVAEGGLTPNQLAFAVMKAVMPEIIAATTKAAGGLGGSVGEAAGDAMKKAGEGLQKMLGGGKK